MRFKFLPMAVELLKPWYPLIEPQFERGGVTLRCTDAQGVVESFSSMYEICNCVADRAAALAAETEPK